VYTLLSALGFAAVSTFTQIAMNEGASLWNVLMWRFVIGAAVMVAFAVLRRYRWLPFPDALRWLVLGGGGQALLIGMALSSLRFISVATLAFLFYTYPAWVVAVQTVRGAERLTRPRLVALLLSLSGIVIIAGVPASAHGLPWQGAALGLGAAIVYAIYIPLMQWMQRAYPVPLTSAYAKLGSAVCFLALGAYASSITTELTETAWVAVVGLALLSTVLPAVFFMMGLLRLGPVRTAIVSTVEPFITAILGALVLAQPVSAGTVFGGTMIVVAVVLLQTQAGKADMPTT
jgi:drug/metabolite transporter (DMT)-like permease